MVVVSSSLYECLKNLLAITYICFTEYSYRYSFLQLRFRDYVTTYLYISIKGCCICHKREKNETLFCIVLNNHPLCFWCIGISMITRALWTRYIIVLSAVAGGQVAYTTTTTLLLHPLSAPTLWLPTLPPPPWLLLSSSSSLNSPFPPIIFLMTVVYDREVVTEWDTNFFMVIALHHRRRAPMIKLPNEWEATYLV